MILGPEEQFNVLSLSGGRPKKPDAIQTLVLKLGPEFMTDIITVISYHSFFFYKKFD